jgi:hypothetical protein
MRVSPQWPRVFPLRWGSGSPFWRYDASQTVVQSSSRETKNPMTDLGAVLEQLKVERAQLDKAISALSGVVEISGTSSSNGRQGKRTLSASARKRIAAAQRARWAKVRAGNEAPKLVSVPKKRTMSAAGRKRIAAAQRARWANIKARKAA